mmetsp:Transcript_25368/g.51000  ORF Transcript_25368/g.51000 Transcript_25368/m.51000 type:complete len:195 (-) Transcript_25368:7-591(-)
MPIRVPDPADDNAAHGTCCICLDTIPTNARVGLPCGHDTFCGQCLVTHLLREVRCPVCCQGGNNNNDYDDESIISDIDEPRFFNSRTQCMKLAHKDKKNKHSFELIKAYRKEASEASKESKVLKLKTRDADKIFRSDMQLYEAKLNAKFTKKYGAIEAKITNLNKTAHIAKGRIRAIETRLVKKYANAPPNATA